MFTIQYIYMYKIRLKTNTHKQLILLFRCTYIIKYERINPSIQTRGSPSRKAFIRKIIRKYKSRNKIKVLNFSRPE